MENGLKIIDERELLGKQFKIYGDLENPLFLAKDVASWIGHTNVTKMLLGIDDEEKLVLKIPSNNLLEGLQKNTEYTFLTEDGLYEVLMLSKKPIAKEFKKEVKKILKLIRKSKMNFPYQVMNNLVERLRSIDESYCDEIEIYKDKISELERKNKKLENEVQYLYSDEDYFKKSVIKNDLGCNLPKEVIKKYTRLYRLFKKIYGISLRQECDRYNRTHKGLPNISVLHYCLIKGYINDLYTCYETLFVER